jgi:2-polyprenyl-6-methoxyphenol hydroxylase-like FAD-dependent oxidoreductase
VPDAEGRPVAIIIGASITGLFTALLLRQAGWATEIFERSAVELKGRGAGIVTHPELIDILEESGIETANLGVTVEERITLDEDARVVGRLRLPQVVTSWDRLHQLVRAPVQDPQHHLGHTLAHVEQDESGATAYFTNGRSARGDILVAADGFRSAVRAQFAPEVIPIYAGYVIWRGLAEELMLSLEARTKIFDRFTFFVAPGHEVIAYPIAGADNALQPGQRRYNWAWYRVTAPELLREMMTDEDGKSHDASIPPQLIRQAVVTNMREAARDLLPEPLFDTLRVIPRPFFTPIYDHCSTRMVFGRVVLVGDAAFLARPHVGVGVTKGAGDARALARAVSNDNGNLRANLLRFEPDRLAFGMRAVTRGRQLGASLSSHAGLSTAWDHVQGSRDLLRDTAVGLPSLAQAARSATDP